MNRLIRERCGKAVSSKSANLRIAQRPFEAVKTGRQAAKLRTLRVVFASRRLPLAPAPGTKQERSTQKMLSPNTQPNVTTQVDDHLKIMKTTMLDDEMLVRSLYWDMSCCYGKVMITCHDSIGCSIRKKKKGEYGETLQGSFQGCIFLILICKMFL